MPVAAGAGGLVVIVLAVIGWKCRRHSKPRQDTEHVRFNVMAAAEGSSANFGGPPPFGGKGVGSLDKITLTDAPKSDWSRFSQTAQFSTARI